MADKKNLTIDQGATFSSMLNVADTDGTAFDLAGYSGEAQCRKTYTSLLAYDFDVAMDTVHSTITISMTAAETAAIPAGDYVYDIQIFVGEVRYRIVEGLVTISPAATKS